MPVLEQPSPALEEAQERRGRRTLEPSRSLQAKCAESGGGVGAPSAWLLVAWERGTVPSCGPESLWKMEACLCRGSQPRLNLRFTSHASDRDSGSSQFWVLPLWKARTILMYTLGEDLF